MYDGQDEIHIHILQTGNAFIIMQKQKQKQKQKQRHHHHHPALTNPESSTSAIGRDILSTSTKAAGA